MPTPTYIPNINDGPGGPALTTDPSQFNVPVTPPKTTTVTPPPATNTGPGPGIVSSTDAQNSLNSDGSKLDEMTTKQDPYLEYLQKKANDLITNPSGPGVEEKNAAFQGGRLQQKVEKDYAAYKAGLETLGIQSGLSQFAPGLQADKMINAANDETAKLSEIQDKENLAVAKAKQARLNNDAATLKSTMAEIRQIKQDKAQELERQLSKRTQDATVARNISNYAFKELQTMDPSKKEAFILQLSKDNQINPATLMAALAEESDTQAKFAKSMSTSGGSSKLLSTAALNYIKKNNPLVDIGFGDTQADADTALATAKEISSAVNTAYKNPALLGPQGKFTYDYINNALDALPEGISRLGFLSSIKDKLALGSKGHKGYNITQDEYDQLTQ